MQISEVAARLGLSARSIRFYEEKGLISPVKARNNGYRDFAEEDLGRLQTIAALREAGLGIEDVRMALERLDANLGEELREILELQRSVLYAGMLENKRRIQRTELLIERLRVTGSLPLEELSALTAEAKQEREARTGWRDRWDWSSRADRHDEEVAGTGPDAPSIYSGYEDALNTVFLHAQPSVGEHGLDAGAGTGNLAARCASGGALMMALDQSREMLRICEAKYPLIETRQGNLVELPLPDDQFDFFVSSFAFRHLNEPQLLLALAEAQRVLKPGGRLCIADLMTSDAETARLGEHLQASVMVEWLEDHGYGTRLTFINEQTYVLYAKPVPVNPHYRKVSAHVRTESYDHL